MQFLRYLLWPFSMVYATVVYCRNLFYDWGVFNSQDFKTPTLCVGNLSVGGTGKTPMIEYLIRHLNPDLKLAVLSRGYRRQSKGFVLGQAGSSVKDLGDEPFQIFKKFPEVQVAVDEDRIRGIQQLKEQIGPELILLDDAFQHRRVKPSHSLVLTQHSNLYTRDFYLPMGRLRDARNQVKRADGVMVTKCPVDLSAKQAAQIEKELGLNPEQELFFSTLRYDTDLQGGDEPLPLSEMQDQPFALVTGIANPTPLVEHMDQLGLDYEHFRFADHHYFTENELYRFHNFKHIICTEKDFTRLEGRVDRLFYLKVRHELLFDGQDRLQKCLNKWYGQKG